MTKLWIDDQRALPSFYDVRASTVEEAIGLLEGAKKRGETFEVISFDYDAHATYSWTFINVAWWMKENDFWPDEIRIHTFNYWDGRPWYEGFFAVHAPATTTIDKHDPWDYAPYLSARARLDLADAPEWVAKFVQEVSVNG